MFSKMVTLCFSVFVGFALANDENMMKKNTKRGVFGYGFDSFPVQSDLGPWNSHAALAHPELTVAKYTPYTTPSVSPAEIAVAVSAAKDASAQVLAAQQRVLAAKQAVVEQQHLAAARESAARDAQTRSEAAAQAQRAEASAAATSVVLAQQRLAEAKAQVAARQRIAAVKESHAAIVIQKSANAAAAHIQQTDAEAAKLAALQRSKAAAIQHVSAAKDASLAAAAAALLSGAHPISAGPWATQAFGLHLKPSPVLPVPYNPWG